jgi:hypothetical protein
LALCNTKDILGLAQQMRVQELPDLNPLNQSEEASIEHGRPGDIARDLACSPPSQRVQTPFEEDDSFDFPTLGNHGYISTAHTPRPSDTVEPNETSHVDNKDDTQRDAQPLPHVDNIENKDDAQWDAQSLPRAVDSASTTSRPSCKHASPDPHEDVPHPKRVKASPDHQLPGTALSTAAAAASLLKLSQQLAVVPLCAQPELCRLRAGLSVATPSTANCREQAYLNDNIMNDF